MILKTLQLLSLATTPNSQVVVAEHAIQDTDWSDLACPAIAAVLGTLTGPFSDTVKPIIKSKCDEAHSGTTILHPENAISASENYVDGYQHSDNTICSSNYGCSK